MKKILLILALAVLIGSSCRMGRRVKGNGVINTEVRNVGNTDRIKLTASFDVEITQGPVSSVRVEADENILPYIITEEREGFLVIKSRDNANLSTEHDIKIYITTAKLEAVHLSGSGNVVGMNKFTASSKMVLKVSGSGDIRMDVNSPDIQAEISGSGSMLLKGETRDESIHISGSGDYTADELKAENVKVKVSGSGNIKVFADHDLDINISGVGSVAYKGSPTIKQRIAGSGDIKKID